MKYFFINTSFCGIIKTPVTGPSDSAARKLYREQENSAGMIVSLELAVTLQTLSCNTHNTMTQILAHSIKQGL